MTGTVDLIALHEAAHAVVASGLSGRTLRLVGAIAHDKAGVFTRHGLTGTAAEDMATHEKLALIDLSGAAAELRQLREAWKSDERNAMGRALSIVLLRRGLARDAVVTDEMKAEATALVGRLRVRAEQIVATNWPAIQRVAAALADGRTLNASEVDALLEP